MLLGFDACTELAHGACRGGRCVPIHRNPCAHARARPDARPNPPTHAQLDGAHQLGCTSVSWAPAAPRGSLVHGKPPGQPVRRFASAGCDNAVRVWAYDERSRSWQQEGEPLAGHSDWVRDVAWAPSLGLPGSTIASAGQDGRVVVWSERSEGGWDQVRAWGVEWKVGMSARGVAGTWEGGSVHPGLTRRSGRGGVVRQGCGEEARAASTLA